MANLQPSLLEHLDIQQVNCLNEAPDHTLQSILASKAPNNISTISLLSNADEQLLLNIAFNQTVSVRSIVIKSSVAAQAPQSVKLFINKPSIGFEDVDSDGAPAIQLLELSEAQVTKGELIPLNYVRFQAVNSLHIFVSSNHGNDDQTRIDAIDVLGFLASGPRDLSGLGKTEE